MARADCLAAQGKNLHILASTFPVCQIVRNVTRGSDRVQVDLMLPAGMGCPHDYALTPQDMRKLAQADIFVINGLGLEEFLGTPVRHANPSLAIIDSTKGFDGILNYHDPHHAVDHAGTGDEAFNPHLFVSPCGSAYMARRIAVELGRLDPEGAQLYGANADNYAAVMDDLLQACNRLGRQMKNGRIVVQHGIFDYLAADMHLDIVATLPDHEGTEPSAADLLDIIKTVKRAHAAMIFSEPSSAGRAGTLVAKETGIPEVLFDTTASGPEDAPLDFYPKTMQVNLKMLETLLGDD